MKVTVESDKVAEHGIPLQDMGENGLSVGIVTSALDWAESDLGMPVFYVRSDLYYFPHDDTWTGNVGAKNYSVRPLRDGERVVITN